MSAKRYKPEKVSSGVISSRANFCAALGITEIELDQALSIPISDRYSEPRTPQLKRDGTRREVLNPCALLRKIQRRMNTRLFAKKEIIAWPHHLYGSIPSTLDHSTDYVACAGRHCNGTKSIITLDLRNFFDNISHERVVGIFRSVFLLSEDVAEVAAQLVCHEGRVPQGGLTSSYIASLCLYDCEGEVVRRLEDKGLTYTRLVDDITISSKIANYDFSYALRVVTAMLDHAGLPLHLGKHTVQYSSTAPLTVHGLRVAFDRPRLPSDEIRRICAAVQSLELVATEPGYRCARGYRADFNRCMGRVNKLSRVGHHKHQEYVRRLRKILPLPMKSDIDWCTKQIERLERTHSTKADTFGYHLRYWILHDRLGILKRSFPGISKQLRDRWHAVKPTYD